MNDFPFLWHEVLSLQGHIPLYKKFHTMYVKISRHEMPYFTPQ